ncbi:hypothetical protein PtB15_6B545 [Puccinia triticina]|nr:hypothetical protein PtB15_6B545 [Puccinia triticina]
MSALRDSAESAVPVGLRPPNHTTTRAPMSGAANESAHPTEPAVGRGQWPSRPCLDCLGWHVVHKRPRRAGPGGHASVGVRNGRVTWWGCGCRALVGLMPWPVVPAIERLMNCPHGGRYGASRYPEGPRATNRYSNSPNTHKLVRTHHGSSETLVGGIKTNEVVVVGGLASRVRNDFSHSLGASDISNIYH